MPPNVRALPNPRTPSKAAASCTRSKRFATSKPKRIPRSASTYRPNPRGGPRVVSTSSSSRSVQKPVPRTSRQGMEPAPYRRAAQGRPANPRRVERPGSAYKAARLPDWKGRKGPRAIKTASFLPRFCLKKGACLRNTFGAKKVQTKQLLW